LKPVVFRVAVRSPIVVDGAADHAIEVLLMKSP
jgi:hypothetical protein